MRNLTFGIPLLAALVGGSASAVQLTGETAPVILSTETDGSGRVMTIVGRNFGDQAPAVTLAERPVLVQSATPTQLTVRLPKTSELIRPVFDGPALAASESRCSRATDTGWVVPSCGANSATRIPPAASAARSRPVPWLGPGSFARIPATATAMPAD